MSRSTRVLAGMLLLLAGVAGCRSVTTTTAPTATPEVRYERTQWSALPGWKSDRAHESWSAFLASCRVLGKRAEWVQVCEAARTHMVDSAAAAHSFFERHFDAYRVTLQSAAGESSDSGLITGYYEPLLQGSRTRTARHTVPLYAPPNDLLRIELAAAYPELQGKRVRGRLDGNRVVPYPERAAMNQHPAVKGKEIIWVDNPVDAFFLEVQGSGRVQLDTGEILRIAYADQNGHAYRSIGRYLVEQGELSLEAASAPGIRQWLAANPQRMQEVFNTNPSVVFFRLEALPDPSVGPHGSLGVPLTAGRSLAVDPQFLPLGAPVFLATTFPETAQPLQRLMLAQDTGGAIRGAIRADFFWGFGAEAAEQAGRMRQQGQLWLLWPKGSVPRVQR